MAIKIAGNAGPNVEVETNTLAMRVVVRPNDYGSLGIYQIGGISGTIGAGQAASAPVFSFRYGSTNLAIVRKVVLSVGSTSTAFTAGVCSFAMLVARTFTGSDTGGTGITPTSTSNRLRTTMATTGVTDIRISSTTALSPGNRTLDTQNLGAITSSVPATGGTQILSPYPIFESRASEYPLVCAQNEGFVVQATVPATGTWTFGCNVMWEELSAYGTALAT